MASNNQIVKNYFNQSGAKVGSNIFWESDTIYSYGHHFPLCIRLDTGHYIINADKYSVTTSNHTALCIHNAPKNTPCIPFSSLSRIHQKENIHESVTDMIKRIKLIEIGEPFYTPRIRHLDKKDWDIKDVSEQIERNKWRLIKETDKKIIVTVPTHHLGYTLFEYNNKSYLSGMDDNHYFLCELVDRCINIEEALRSMAGNLNDIEYNQYKEGTIKRQGEFFFIPIPELTFNKELIKKKTAIPQSNGTASHIANSLRIADKFIYAKGRIIHNRHDHKSVFLDCWHKVVLNTVKESWTSNGRVD